MKFVIEFDDDDIGEFIEEFGDDIKDHIRKRIKDALTEEFGDDIKESIIKRKKTALDSALASYNDYRNRVREKIEEDSSSSYPVTEITFETKEEADAVLYDMRRVLNKFNNVQVFDYYDLVGTTCSTTDRLYGWTDLKGAYVKPTYEYSNLRWAIELPKPVRLHRYDQVK